MKKESSISIYLHLREIGALFKFYNKFVILDRPPFPE